MITAICDFCGKEVEEFPERFQIWAPNSYGNKIINGLRYANIDLCRDCYYTHILDNLDRKNNTHE